jgi:hypothetical protein
VSENFDGITEPGEVLRGAAELLPVLNGIGGTRLKAFEPLHLEATVEHPNPDGTIRVHKEFASSARVLKEEARAFSDATRISTSPEEAATWMNAADADYRVSRALSIYGALGHIWRGPYMVLDVVSEDLGDGEEMLLNQKVVGCSSPAERAPYS